MPKKWLINGFLFSVCLHLLLLLCMLTISVTQQEKEKLPTLYVPAQIYTGHINPTISAQQSPHPQRQKPNQLPLKKNGIHQKSLFAASLDMLQETQHQMLTPTPDTEPIYLIGDMSGVANPLIKLLGKALSAHIAYPRMAATFGIKGRAVIGMTLHPAGHLTDVQLLQSSNNQELDSAALYAVNSAPTIVGVDRFLSKPRHFIIGFIFR